MITNDLFANAEENERQVTLAEDRVSFAAHRLTVDFTEDELLPTRYRKSANANQKKRKQKEDSEIDKRFKSSVQVWVSLIEMMLTKLDSEQVWRFINLTPEVEDDLTKVTDNVDFCDLIDYLSLRRDKENCDADELGCLAQLSVAFQECVAKRIT